MFEVTFEVLLLLMAAGFAAGFIDAVAGGGGLITVPILLIAGANPVTALATNKIQGLFGAATAAITYARGGHVDLRTQWKPAVIAFFASIGGALLVYVLPVDLIRYALPILLIGIAVFFGSDAIDKPTFSRRWSSAISPVQCSAFLSARFDDIVVMSDVEVVEAPPACGGKIT